ncbi:hypothetical protein MKK88_12170 [Methylobacterium sp. E-005]|uniref:hypothetical protein n=1 Tax=Methylobacterium sp. E-005 TaxID=2836549 RepID=UPI001FBA7D0F|nr:hypothetical protein [Methylobacterium sp. E-005]MCJ2086741.1 hypothetical protein [Methylobacterium sp. E-005]
MTITIKDHGVWNLYVPEVLPDWAIEVLAGGVRAAFSRRDGDGVDWYEYRMTPNRWAPESLVATTQSFPGVDGETVQGVFRDFTMPFPMGMRVIEILGVSEDDEKPHKLFEQQRFDLSTLTIAPFPEKPAAAISVSSAQALIQLSRMPHDGSVVPGAKNLAEATEALVAQSGDYELKTWFARAQRWVITNPNVRKIGAAFGLSDDEILSAFQAAQQIAE